MILKHNEHKEIKTNKIYHNYIVYTVLTTTILTITVLTITILIITILIIKFQFCNHTLAISPTYKSLIAAHLSRPAIRSPVIGWSMFVCSGSVRARRL